MNKIILRVKKLPKTFAITIIKGYQKGFSPFLGRHCKFYPTCSEYTKQAIDKYGIIKGTLKGFLRISKCNPFSKGGIDNLK